MAKKSSTKSNNTEINEEQLKEKHDELYKLWYEEISKKCEERDIPTAMMIVVDPELPHTPIIYECGHDYDKARIAIQLAKYAKSNLMHSDGLRVL